MLSVGPAASGCSLGPEFWVTLPTTIGAVGALIASVRASRNTRKTARKVDAHRAEANNMRAHFEAVIRQLETRAGSRRRTDD